MNKIYEMILIKGFLFFVFFMCVVSLWAEEGYKKIILRDIPVGESEMNYEYGFDNKGDLYVLEKKNELVRIFDKKNNLLNTVDWSKQNKGRCDKTTYRLIVDDKGNFVVWTIKYASFLFDRNGKFISEFYFHSWEDKIYDHLKFYDGVLYSELTGKIVLQMDKVKKVSHPYFIEDFQLMVNHRDRGKVTDVKLVNKKNGRLAMLPKLEGFGGMEVEAIDHLGNVYVSYFSDTRSETREWTSKIKTLMLDKNLKVLTWYDGREKPDSDPLNNYAVDRTKPKKYSVVQFKWLFDR